MSAVLHYGGSAAVLSTTAFAEKLAASLQLLREAQAEFGAEQLTQACSLGVEDMLLLHLRAQVAGNWPVFVLETGKLHAQTLRLLVQAEAHFGLQFLVLRPDAQAAQALEAEHGAELMYASLALRKACCEVRKMQPLQTALAGKRAWITGLRQEQSAARARVDLRETEHTATGSTRVKLNPLAHWTRAEMWQFVAREGIPYNPLHDAFYPSIGCAPCTRAISLGEDERAGRWWWESSSKECGLHAADSPDSPTVDSAAASQAVSWLKPAASA